MIAAFTASLAKKVCVLALVVLLFDGPECWLDDKSGSSSIELYAKFYQCNCVGLQKKCPKRFTVTTAVFGWKASELMLRLDVAGCIKWLIEMAGKNV